MEPSSEAGDYFVGTDSDFERWIVAKVARAAAAKETLSQSRASTVPPTSPELGPENGARAAAMHEAPRSERVPSSSDRHSISELLNDEPQGMKRDNSGRLREPRDRSEANASFRDSKVNASAPDDPGMEGSRKERRHDAPAPPSVGPPGSSINGSSSNGSRSRKAASDDEITVIPNEPMAADDAAHLIGSLAGGSRTMSDPSGRKLKPAAGRKSRLLPSNRLQMTVQVVCWHAEVGDAGTQHELIGAFSAAEIAWKAAYLFAIDWAMTNSDELMRRKHEEFEVNNRLSKDYQMMCGDVLSTLREQQWPLHSVGARFNFTMDVTQRIMDELAFTPSHAEPIEIADEA